MTHDFANKIKQINKAMVIAVIVVLCFALVGCRSEEKSEYDESTNQQEDFHGIEFQVPQSWKLDVKNDNSVSYILQENNDDEKNNMTLVLMGSSKDYEKVEDDYWNRLTASKEDGLIETINKSTITVNRETLTVLEYTEKGKEDFPAKLVLVQGTDEIIGITFYATDPVAYEDFEKVLFSIKRTEE
ncbi:hypothetical protein M2140_002163 [Clostridiales Family XIII bacterium PM5-7]